MKRIFLLLVLILVFVGCRPGKPIEVSTHKKPNDVMMVGITVRGSATWTIKLVNDRKKILAAENAVYKFAGSFDFSSDPSNPQWIIPPNWKKLELKRQFRKATFEIQDDHEEEKRTQVIVSELAMGQRPTSPEQSIADNINRWRKQMDLDPVINYSINQSGEEIQVDSTHLVIPFMKPVSVDGQVMYFEKIEGTKPKITSAAPFMSGMPGMDMHGDMAKLISKPKPESETEPDLPFDYTAPDSWTPTTPTSVSILKFNVGNDDSPAEVSVSRFSASASAVTWESTVTMWQGQLKVPQTKGEALTKITETVLDDQLKGKLVSIKGGKDKSGTSLLGVMIENDGKWFFKMQGSSKTVEKERANFEAFVKSIQYRSNEK